MISDETARKLKETATDFHAADAALRQTEEPTEQTDFVPKAATEYIEKLRAHQAQIEVAEGEIDQS